MIVRIAVKPSKALRHALQLAERRTSESGDEWVVIDDRARSPHVSPYRVKPAASVVDGDVVCRRQS